MFSNEPDFHFSSISVESPCAEMVTLRQLNSVLGLTVSGSFELLIDWLLTLIAKSIKRLDRIIFLKFDKQQKKWIVIQDMSPGVIQMLPEDPYESSDLFNEGNTNELIFSPKEGIGADAGIRFVFNKTLYQLVFDDTSSKRQFTDNEVKILHEAVLVFYYAMSIRFAVPQTYFAHQGRMDSGTALGNRRAFVQALNRADVLGVMTLSVDYLVELSVQKSFVDVEMLMKNLAEIVEKYRNMDFVVKGELFRTSRNGLTMILTSNFQAQQYDAALRDLFRRCLEDFSQLSKVRVSDKARSLSLSGGFCLWGDRKNPDARRLAVHAVNAATYFVQSQQSGSALKEAVLPKSISDTDIIGRKVEEVMWALVK